MIKGKKGNLQTKRYRNAVPVRSGTKKALLVTVKNI